MTLPHSFGLYGKLLIACGAVAMLVFLNYGAIPGFVVLSVLATIMLTVAGIHLFAVNVGRILSMFSRLP